MIGSLLKHTVKNSFSPALTTRTERAKQWRASENERGREEEHRGRSDGEAANLRRSESLVGGGGDPSLRQARHHQERRHAPGDTEGGRRHRHRR